MQKRVLGKTGLEVSVIGMGGIPAIRGSAQEVQRTIHEAIDLGINYFDTARCYEDSEEKFGKALRGKRDQIILASQAHGRDRKGILKDIETCLKTLGVDCIDVFKMHGVACSHDAVDRVLAPDGAVEGLKEAQRQGKIRFYGASGHCIPVMKRLVESGEVSVILFPFNFVRSEPAEELFPLCAEKGVGVTIMKPLGGGLFQHPDICLRWILEHEEVSTISVGMWKPFEARMNALVGEDPAPLNEEEREWLAAERRRWDREYCRLCEEHAECPNGVPIFNLMLADVSYRRNGLEAVAKSLKRDLDKAMACERCNQCVQTCHYHLPIPDIIQRAIVNYGPIVREYLAREGA